MYNVLFTVTSIEINIHIYSYSLASSFVSLADFNHAVLMCTCLVQQSCMSYTFSISILNIFIFWLVEEKNIIKNLENKYYLFHIIRYLKYYLKYLKYYLKYLKYYLKYLKYYLKYLKYYLKYLKYYLKYQKLVKYLKYLTDSPQPVHEGRTIMRKLLINEHWAPLIVLTTHQFINTFNQ